MEKQLLDILHKYIASDGNTANKIVGAAFIVCNKDGSLHVTHPFPPALL